MKLFKNSEGKKEKLSTNFNEKKIKRKITSKGKEVSRRSSFFFFSPSNKHDETWANYVFQV